MRPPETGPALICDDDGERRRKIRSLKKWSGLDYLEVSQDQREITVFFLDKAPKGLERLRPENFSIRPCEPGAPQVRVVSWRLCRLEDDERDDCLHLTVDRPGGFSPYVLCLVEVDKHGQPTDKPLTGIDPRYSCLELDFKVGCASDLDCKDERRCPPEPRIEPEINYLAKDYGSFRQAILDRLAVTLPDWRERHVPDLGIAVVELLAYVGDHLSYYQDAVAAEAYLNTARRRISVRRHVRLVDYPVHEGCNARTWVNVDTDVDLTLATDGFFCITGFDPARPGGEPLTLDHLRNVPRDRYEVFEPVAEDPVRPIELREAHNKIAFHTWGDRECCLPRGTTRATLKDEWVMQTRTAKAKKAKKGKKATVVERKPAHLAYGYPCVPPPPQPDPKRKLELKEGDLLLFEELLGPKTGKPADADPAHRHVVRLTRVERAVDELEDAPILEIEWAREDALPFPLCVSAIGGEECELLEPVSVARGNVFLADHGRTELGDLGTVPAGDDETHCVGEGKRSEVSEAPGRYRPALTRAPLTFRQPMPPNTRRVPASRLTAQQPRRALPAVELSHQGEPFEDAGWRARSDLLDSGPDDLHFVVEMDDDGRAHLRFGDDELGEEPRAGTAYWARYRVGNGPAGNVGAGSLRHLVLREVELSEVRLEPRNPLPAVGGTAPEPLTDVRLLAPHAFRQEPQRAITPEDYARLVERDFAGRVQRAAAVLRWTGSWPEVLVVVDPLSGEEEDRLLREVRKALHRYRRIGHDVVVKRAVPVPLEIGLAICVQPHYLRGHVRAALLETLSNRALPGGGLGFFHPDRLTFGQGIALSKLIAAAQAVPGVESLEVKTFQRQGEEAHDELENGFLPLGPLEIARLDNDPRFPSNGKLLLDLRGGR